MSEGVSFAGMLVAWKCALCRVQFACAFAQSAACGRAGDIRVDLRDRDFMSERDSHQESAQMTRSANPTPAITSKNEGSVETDITSLPSRDKLAIASLNFRSSYAEDDFHGGAFPPALAKHSINSNHRTLNTRLRASDHGHTRRSRTCPYRCWRRLEWRKRRSTRWRESARSSTPTNRDAAESR